MEPTTDKLEAFTNNFQHANQKQLEPFSEAIQHLSNYLFRIDQLKKTTVDKKRYGKGQVKGKANWNNKKKPKRKSQLTRFNRLLRKL